MFQHHSGLRVRGALRGALLGAAVTVCAWALSAATAHAASTQGSIAYVKGGNVYVATPDGARTRQLTASGVYSDVSRADDGTMIALAGERLHKLSPGGQLLADFATPVSDGLVPPADPNADHFSGPHSLRISPDGTKVAYTYYWRHFTFDYTCNPPTGCYRTRTESGTAITWSDRLTEWGEFGGPLTGWKWASWIDNDHIVRGDAGVVLAENLVINRIAPGLGDDDLLRWVPHNYDIVGDPVINRPRTWLATTTKNWTSQQWSVEVWRMRPLPQQPEYCFRIKPPTAQNFGVPTFSPDGGSLAWQEANGIHVMQLPDPAAPCTGVTLDSGPLVIPGAGAPSWSPAGVPTGGTGANAGATVATRVLSRTALGRGVAKVRVRVPAAGRVTLVARHGGQVVAKGSATATKAGQLAVRLRPTPAGRNKLRSAGRVTLTLTWSPPSGARNAATVAVRLTR